MFGLGRERPLANIDMFVGLARSYAVRGLRAFAEAVTLAWSDEAKAVEGRPDAQQDAVALYTMHAAKGLEWQIVIPINTMTTVMSAASDVVEKGADFFLCPVFGAHPVGYAAAREDEKAEIERERARLWYVAATRAKELQVFLRLDVAPAKNSWCGSAPKLTLPWSAPFRVDTHQAAVLPVWRMC
jgi:exodeoxyribonuclease-5